jgi:hypothetical protein
MKTKSKNKKTIKKDKFSKEINNLEKDLKFTINAIDGKSEQIDSIFKDQAKKIREEIKKIKEQKQ